MSFVYRWVFVLALSAGLMAGAAQAERRVALVVGNGGYEHTTPLKNPGNDARGLAEALRALDFEVLLGIDLDDQAFRRLARDFAAKSEDSDVALFFYAGHGMQVNGRNFLLPVNASLKREIDLEFETLPLELLMSHMERGQRTNIVLLDACRNNPLVDDLARNMGTRSALVGRGLARVETGVGTYVGFSTQPGNVALDGEGDNSPFATALIRHIGTPGLDIETLMRQVREEVIRETKGRQVPWGNSSLVGQGFVFKAAAKVAEPEPSKQERTTLPPTLTDQANIEIAYWNSIKDSGDPTLLEAYLSEFPNGRFARLADILIESLGARERATAPKEEAAVAVPAPAIAAPAPEQPKVAAVDPRQRLAEEPAADPAEAGFWLAVKDTDDAKLLEAYLKRYPKGAFVEDAKKLLEAIRKREAALPATEEAKEEVKQAAPPKPAAVQQPKPKPAPEKKAAPAKQAPPPKVEKKKAPAVAATKPAASPAPKRDACGWCNFARGQTSLVCGREFESLRAARKCI